MIAYGHRPQTRFAASSFTRRGAAGRAARTMPVMKADINVTPLVDVVLVLLIIFMVVTPMLGKGVSVDLPMTRHHATRSDDNRDIVVAVTRAGQIYVGANRTSVADLPRALGEIRRRNPDKALFFKGDARLSFGQARQALDAIHRAGINDIQIATEDVATPH